MKRVFEIVLLLAVIGLVIQLILLGLKDEHKIDYKIVNDKVTFEINEIYKNDYYHIVIQNSNYQFNILLNNDYHKDKKIINNIHYINNTDMMCIYPVIENTSTNIICADKDNTYSYSYVKDNSLVKQFVKNLELKSINNLSWINTSDVEKYQTISYYPNNIDSNLYMYIWKYDGFYILNNKKFIENDIYNRDTYNNNPVFVYGKYYIVADYSKKYDFNTIQIHDMENNTLQKIEFVNELSYNAYFNGMVDKKIYLFDKDHLEQYELDIKKKTYTVVGSKEMNARYYNNEWSYVNVYDMAKKEYKFINNVIPKHLINAKTYQGQDIVIYSQNNKMYLYDSINQATTLLFAMNEIKDIQISDNNIFFIKGDTLYEYDRLSGVMPLVKYKEFSFNKSNMYAVYQK